MIEGKTLRREFSTFAPKVIVAFRSNLRRTAAMILVVMAILPGMGCKKIASISQPDRLYTVDQETAAVRSYYETTAHMWSDYSKATNKKWFRNEMITARMYAIDMEYTEYEAALTRELQMMEFSTDFTNLGLNLAGGIVGGETSRILSVVATGVSGVNSAYTAKILRAKVVENVQASMRAARNQRAAKILANLKCEAADYPLAMALSDVESYYRAGQFHSGLIRMTRVTTKDESQTAAEKDTQSPANPPQAKAVVAAKKTEADVEAQNKNACAGGGGAG